VHGLGGDSFSTWTKDGVNWLSDLLPLKAADGAFQNARIMTYGYDARVFIRPFAAKTTGRTFTFAEALLGDLSDMRSSQEEKVRPLIFMGHSLGGIVIKSVSSLKILSFGC
jgi:protein SERAC1